MTAPTHAGLERARASIRTAIRELDALPADDLARLFSAGSGDEAAVVQTLELAATDVDVALKRLTGQPTPRFDLARHAPMTVLQAADRLEIGPAAVRDAIRRGALAATKLGRDFVLEYAEVERYALERRRPAAWQADDARR